MANTKQVGNFTRAGYGHQGYCKLCSISDPVLQDDFDRRVRLEKKNFTGNPNHRFKYSADALREWLREHDLGAPALPTIYQHREHVAHPKDRLVSAVKKRELTGYTPRAKVGEEEFLDTIISLGHQRISQNPDEVTIDQALKATQIRANMKRQGQDVKQLVAIFTGGQPPPQDIIEGEVREA